MGGGAIARFAKIYCMAIDCVQVFVLTDIRSPQINRITRLHKFDVITQM